MGWEYRKKDQHVCKKPTPARDIHVGDIWKCDECAVRYQVTKISMGSYDQREGGYYGGSIEWDIIPRSDPGVTSWRDR